MALKDAPLGGTPKLVLVINADTNISSSQRNGLEHPSHGCSVLRFSLTILWGLREVNLLSNARHDGEAKIGYGAVSLESRSN